MSLDGHMDNAIARDLPDQASSSPLEEADRIAPSGETETSSNRNDLSKNRPVETQDSSNTGAAQHLIRKASEDARPVETSVVPLLRYRKTSLFLLALYIPLLVLPWILTCIMAIRPPSLPSYYNQAGDYCLDTYTTMLFWLAFVRVLNSIASILVVPVTSALLAQGAVVYTQRRKSGQSLNLRQLFALSDRGWNDISTLWGAYKGRGTASKYLTGAVCLLLLTPVQQALIGYEITVIMTCADHPANYPPIAGYDPEPYALAVTPQILVIPDLIKSLATVNDKDTQTHLWHDGAAHLSTLSGSDEGWSGTLWAHYNGQGDKYFVSALANNTDTGVLREHVVRLNSSAECQTIDEADFPDNCDGSDPFQTSYNSQDEEFGSFDIDVCVPGNQSASAWTLSRDRQDIVEDLYIKVHVGHEPVLAGYVTNIPENFTVHCTANSTRGYFELPNWRNNFIAGPLLEKWPDNDTLSRDFNDYLYETSVIVGIPTTEDAAPLESLNGIQRQPSVYDIGDWRTPMDPFNRFVRPTPGPLMTSALAMLGQGSFFYGAKDANASTALQQICQGGNIPFSRLDGSNSFSLYDNMFSACRGIETANSSISSSQVSLDHMLYEWFSTFKPDNLGSEALEVAMFFANQHWLTETARATKTLYSARNIYTSPGLAIPRPVVPLYAQITVSIFIALQLLGLGLLITYIYSMPTWTDQLDSCAIAQLTHDVNSGIFSTINKPDEKALEGLKDLSGLVGVSEIENKNDTTSKSDEQQAASDADGTETASSGPGEHDEDVQPVSSGVDDSVNLSRGGAGLITKRHASFKEWKPKFKRRKATKESLLEKGPTEVSSKDE